MNYEAFKNTAVPHACLIISTQREAGLNAAYRLAAIAMCSGEGERPCGICRDCRKLASKLHPDLAVISRPLDDSGKRKREISVSQIRNLISDASVLPNEAEHKVYIIDEAESMNIPAQNTALKLLEEPPSAVILLLCTSNASMLLPTVRSRCAEYIVKAEEQSADEELSKLSDEYIKLVSQGNRARLLRWCAEQELMGNARVADFFACLRGRLSDILCRRSKSKALTGEDAVRLLKLCDKCSMYLKANVSAKQLFGLLAVDSIAGGGNRGISN